MERALGTTALSGSSSCSNHKRPTSAATAWEVLRRLSLVVALPVGALMIAWTTPMLVGLSSIDWETERRHEIAALLSDEERLDLNVYIAQQTKDHLATLPAAPWSSFIGQARETLAGRAPTSAWSAAAEWSSYYRKVRLVYLNPRDPFAAKLLALPEMADGYAYLRLEGEESTPPTLKVQRFGFDLAQSGAPQHLVHPWRHTGWWVILTGVLIYAAIPWSRPAANQFCPMTPGMAFLADLVGVMLYGGFLFIWAFLILSRSVPGHGELSQILVFTLVFWGMALGGLAILGVALWYITFRFEWDEEGIRLRTLFRDAFQPWEEILGLSLQPIIYRFAQRFRVIALLLSVFNWRIAGPALLMQTESVGLHLAMRDGHGWKVDLGNLSPQGLRHLVSELQQREIPVSEDVTELCPAEEDTQAPPKLLPIYLTLAVLAGLVLYALWQTSPPTLG